MSLSSAAAFLPSCVAINNSIPFPINTRWEFKFPRRGPENLQDLSLIDLFLFPIISNKSFGHKFCLSNPSRIRKNTLWNVCRNQIENQEGRYEEAIGSLVNPPYYPSTNHHKFFAGNLFPSSGVLEPSHRQLPTDTTVYKTIKQQDAKPKEIPPAHSTTPLDPNPKPEITKVTEYLPKEAPISSSLLLSSIHPPLACVPEISFTFESEKILKYLGVAYQSAYTAYKGSYIILASSPLFLMIGLQNMIPANYSLNSRIENYFWNYFFWFSQLAGPTFIKFLQWAATRVDIFPLETCKRFAKFHYFGMLHSYNETILQLQLAFGENWRDWLTFDPTPIGSGCIAQVYKGYIKNKDGTKEEVAIKVAHPHIRSIMENDFFVLKCFAHFCSYLPIFQWINIKDSVDQFCSTMEKQLDLQIEAENMQKFGQNFGNLDKIISRRGGSVHFPKPYLNYSNKHVLISSYEGGGLHIGEWMKLYHSEENATHKHVSDHELNLFEKMRKDIGFTGMMAFLKMLFVDNFVHLDLHPGNIILRFPKDSNVGFELVFLDCGLTTSMKKSDQKNLFDLFYAIFQNNGIEAGNLLLTRSNRQACINQKQFSEEIATLLNTLNLKDEGGYFKSKKLFFGEILYKMMKLSNEHRVELDANFISIICALLVLDGVGHQLDTTFNVLDAALPFRSLISQLN